MQWKPDSLFYQAHVYQVRGDSHAVAYRKVFAGPLSLPRREGDAGLPLEQRRVGNPAWVSYSERFYERRWFVPALAALISPLYGTDSLRVVSLVAYVLMGVALYALLRLRAAPVVSFLVAAGALFLAPVLFSAGLPLMDVTGVTLETLAALGAFLTLERSWRWLALWGVALAALSLTRDSTVILGLAAVWLAVRERDTHFIRTRRGRGGRVSPVSAHPGRTAPRGDGIHVRELLPPSGRELALGRRALLGHLQVDGRTQPDLSLGAPV